MARLTEVDVDYISLVSKAANKQKINIYKSDEYEPETTQENDEEMKGFFNVLKSFFSKDDKATKDKDIQKEPEGDEDLKKEDIAEIVKEAVAPLQSRLDEIEKGDTKADDPIKETELSKEDIAKAVIEAITPLTERIEKIENFKGISKQEEGTDETDINKSTSTFAGINI